MAGGLLVVAAAAPEPLPEGAECGLQSSPARAAVYDSVKGIFLRFNAKRNERGVIIVKEVLLSAAGRRGIVHGQHRSICESGRPVSLFRQKSATRYYTWLKLALNWGAPPQ